MKSTQRFFTVMSATLLLAATAAAQAPAQGQQGGVSPSVWAAPPAPAGQASSAFQSACGNQPMCYDAPDFAVAVVDFRMSITAGLKVMDATLRFVNKTNQPLILGYVDGSGVALDDQGNRYAPYANHGMAGIGLIYGASGDPKFVVQPGGAGDARWELLWRPGAQDPIGSTFELGMTVREINTLTGGQHTLGAEVPLRFQGLANGMTGGSPSPVIATGASGVAGASPIMASASSSGLPPCGPSGSAAGTMTAVAGAANSVGGQTAANASATATNTASNALAQLSNLKSIFSKKNAASTPATNVAGAAPCIPSAANPATPVAAGTSTAPAAAGQPAAATPTAGTAAAKTTAATPANAAPANTRTSAAASAKTAAPNAAKAPVNTAPNAATPNTAKPAVVTTAAPNSKAVAKPATQPVAKKPATTPAPSATTPPAKP